VPDRLSFDGDSALVGEDNNLKTMLVKRPQFLCCGAGLAITVEHQPVIFVFWKRVSSLGSDQSPVHVKTRNLQRQSGAARRAAVEIILIWVNAVQEEAMVNKVDRNTFVP
jgi:hypothetical protein